MPATSSAGVVSNYKITKSESYSQPITCTGVSGEGLYLITKLQNLKAIHNFQGLNAVVQVVVSNYKITKSESYSQRTITCYVILAGCI